ncbi:MAG: hypothetical protein JST58_04490 [Bacteroidetes bacterium]|nr:hypothetical protein [Bacteroidota bacterium]
MHTSKLLFPILFLTACTNHTQTIAHSLKLDSSFNYIYTKLSGKSYTYKPGQYKKGKTLAFFITKENDIAQDSIISEKLYENNLFASNSAELKTVVLIYKSDDINERQNHAKADSNYENGYQICFIDTDSMCSRKIVTINPPDLFLKKRELIAQTIIDNFK